MGYLVSWKRINPKESGIDGHNALVRRIYGLHGRPFPRISIAVYGLRFMLDRDPNDALRMVRKETAPNSWKIAAMAKKDKDSFPETATIPFDLTDELIEMIQEAQGIVESIQK